MNFTINTKNGTADGYVLIKTVEKKLNVKGVPYLDLLICDSDGEIVAKLWDYKEEIHGMYEAGELIKVRGTLSSYNGTDQMRIEKIRKTNSLDNVDIADFVPSAEYSGEAMYNELIDIANGFNDKDITKIVVALLEENREKLLFWPAAYRLHHAIRGGLLYHTLSIVRLAQSVCDVYHSLDRDLLLGGAILHDIAKIEEYNVNAAGIATNYSVTGELVGHLVQGAMRVRETAKELGVKEETAVLLEHMLISHHGEPDFGVAVRPMTMEAEVLSQLAKLDATL
ncbi:MAG: HDIG domain-containing protein, partial [Clostridia bacterium]|nr:HDIG domain-containing protein [Clostridia bacterium]